MWIYLPRASVSCYLPTSPPQTAQSRSSIHISVDYSSVMICVPGQEGRVSQRDGFRKSTQPGQRCERKKVLSGWKVGVWDQV